MKLFTICLVPVAAIGAGIIVSIGVKLFYFGWCLGREMVGWVKSYLKKLLTHS